MWMNFHFSFLNDYYRGEEKIILRNTGLSYWKGLAGEKTCKVDGARTKARECRISPRQLSIFQ